MDRVVDERFAVLIKGYAPDEAVDAAAEKIELSLKRPGGEPDRVDELRQHPALEARVDDAGRGNGTGDIDGGQQFSVLAAPDGCAETIIAALRFDLEDGREGGGELRHIVRGEFRETESGARRRADDARCLLPVHRCGGHIGNDVVRRRGRFVGKREGAGVLVLPARIADDSAEICDRVEWRRAPSCCNGWAGQRHGRARHAPLPIRS